ncbi:MAG: DUF4255 domain-containing protein [Cyanobacteria bacterium P01_F01_bin.150]
MSNHLAIATVTATLQHILQVAIQYDVEGAAITTVSLNEIGKKTPENGVNLFIYQVTTDPGVQKQDDLWTKEKPIQPTVQQVALDIRCMISFYGSNSELIPQRLLGRVVHTLSRHPVITQTRLQDACANSTAPFLRNSGLASQVQQIKVLPLNLELEKLSKTWSFFSQTPYILSLAYKILVVLAEGDKTPYSENLPIGDRQPVELTPFPSPPRVEQIVAKGGLDKPIFADSTLMIYGHNLKGKAITQVRIGGVGFTPTAVSNNQLTLPLADLPSYVLRVGVQSLQVVHSASSTDRFRSIYPVIESNAMPFVLRPQVIAVGTDHINEADDGMLTGMVTVEVNLAIAPEQRVVLALNEIESERPNAYMFDVPCREQSAHRVMIPIKKVKPGIYLARLLIDGAESQLEMDTDTNSPTYERYIGPRLEIQPLAVQT